ncbi:type II secretion system F family protein [Actinomadura scrupuli]|uniref:type II secretion system F family protein n=1 Tax=Actinomadura scrupuli TaxID=559629 RepID=UPI003D96D26D
MSAVFGTDVLGAALSGAVLGGGVLLLVMSLRGFPVRPGKPASGRDLRDLLSVFGRRLAIAAGVGAVVLIATQWVVAAVGAGLLVLGWNGIAGGAGEERKAMVRLEGLAAWTESLRDTIAGAVGLEQAIPASLRAAAPALQPPLRVLVDRMHTRMPMAEAMRRFADDLDDPSADLVIGALILNARLRGPGLRDMLSALATSARAELDMRRRVEADRRTTRRSVQIVVLVSVGTSLLLAIFNHDYVQPYDSFLGQLVLIVVIALYAAAFLWLRRLARYELPQRFLAEPGTRPGVPGEVPATVSGWQDSVPLRGRATMDAGGGLP